MRRRRFLTSALALGGAGLAPPAALARRLFPADVTDRYVAWQGDTEIGRQEFSFRRGPGGFTVESTIEMRFVSPRFGETTYEHACRETWDTGWLQSLETETRIGGRRQVVHAEREAGALKISGSDVRAFQLSSYVIPSNLWHRDSRLVRAFIDVESGNLISVQARYAGEESLRQGGAVVEAHRYTIRGQMEREAWYDADCVLVRWDLPLTGGGWINFRRKPA
jgi:hypothetical protein